MSMIKRIKGCIREGLRKAVGKSLRYCTGVLEADVVSFDVFDTLILRKVKDPKDVFSLILPEDPSYKQERIEAERYARGHAKGEDPTLDEIYERIALRYGDQDAQKLKRLEIEKELEVSYADPEALHFFRYLKKKGKRIVITSDMYLPENVIAEILQRNAYSGYDRLYVSAACGVTKSTGRLYGKLVSDLKTGNILHIGDNARTDYYMAKKAGIKAFLYAPQKKIRVFSRSRTEVEEDCRKWAEAIGRDYRPDMIVFVAKSGFLFAKPLAETFGCKMTDISVSRPGNGGKDRIRKLIPRMPEKLLFALLSSKAAYGYQETNCEREVKISERFRETDWGGCRRILLVDDSADTGYSLLAAQKAIREAAPESELRTACYCVIDISKKRVTVDYHRYRNTIVVSATSRYSDEYDDFVRSLELWEKGRG